MLAYCAYCAYRAISKGAHWHVRSVQLVRGRWVGYNFNASLAIYVCYAGRASHNIWKSLHDFTPKPGSWRYGIPLLPVITQRELSNI
jgi:hypothetical protein